MDDKLKQGVALFGGWLGAILLFLQTLNVEFSWFNTDSINAFVVVLMASVPFVVVLYGVYKNSYRLTEKAKRQDELLKQRGLK